MTRAPDVGREDIVDRYQQGLPPAALRDIPEFGAFAVVVLGGGPSSWSAVSYTTLGDTILVERNPPRGICLPEPIPCLFS